MKRLSQRLGGFFYRGYSEESLGLFRVCFGCLLLVYHIPQFATLFFIDPVGASFHYTDPIWYFDLLGIDRTMPWLSLLAGLLLFASTLSMTLGKWTRTSIIVVLICIFYLKGVRDSAAGDVHHRYVVLVQILFFLLLSRSGEAATDRIAGRSAGLLEWEASWPIRAVQVYVAFFYFFALVAKLRVSGWDWFFDGVCDLCNGLVDFVMPRDRRRRFRYATLQSESGQRMLRQLGLPTDELQTFILQENGRAHVKSTAALRVCRRLSGLWPLLYLFIAVPKPLRDAVYGWVGKRRYRFFGRRASCRMPSEEERRLFLE